MWNKTHPSAIHPCITKKNNQKAWNFDKIVYVSDKEQWKPISYSLHSNKTAPTIKFYNTFSDSRSNIVRILTTKSLLIGKA